MKSYTKEREFETSGDAVGMTIDGENFAKIINILVANMYSDKPKSIWREIIANGYDAQRDAGTNHIPMDVTMPSIWEANFKFRDYGTGLSHEFMLNEYCKVGYSSKENTNNAVGKWGLGRLVPLSYTDTYTITSYQGGMARHYSISRSPKGVSCVFMGEQKTKEANGIEVSFPIKKEDADEFAKALKYISLGLDLKPRVVNKPDFQWPSTPIAATGNGWTYLDLGRLDYNSPLKGRAHVRMGCVLYPISDNYELSRESVILEAPIGSLAVTASREALSYGPDEPTDKTIKRLLDKFASEIVAEQVKKTQGAKLYTEALKHHMTALQSLRGSFKNVYTRQVKHWKGYYLPETGVYYPNVDILDWDLGDWRYNDKRVQVTRLASRRALYVGDLDKTTVIVQNVTDQNKDKNAPRRILYWWKNLPDDKRPKNLAWIEVDENDKQSTQNLIEFFCRHPEWPVVLVSDMPEIPKSERVKNKVKAKKLSDHLYSRVYYSSSDTTIEDFDQGGYYIKTDMNSLVGWTGSEELRFLEILKALKVLKEVNDPIYVAPKTLWSKFEGEGSKWIELTPLVNDMLLKHKTGLVTAAESLIDAIRDSWLEKFIGVGNKLIDGYLAGWTQKDYNGLPASYCKILLSYVGVEVTDTVGVRKDALQNRIYNMYPLLRTKDHRIDKKDYIQYLELIDEKLAKQKELANV